MTLSPLTCPSCGVPMCVTVEATQDKFMTFVFYCAHGPCKSKWSNDGFAMFRDESARSECGFLYQWEKLKARIEDEKETNQE